MGIMYLKGQKLVSGASASLVRTFGDDHLVVIEKSHDGLPYQGYGDTFREALESLRARISEGCPSLAHNYRTAPYTPYNESILRDLIGTEYLDQKTGRLETLVALLPQRHLLVLRRSL